MIIEEIAQDLLPQLFESCLETITVCVLIQTFKTKSLPRNFGEPTATINAMAVLMTINV